MTHRSESTPLIKEEPIQSQKAMYDSVATYANNVLSENWAGNINAPDSDCTDSMREILLRPNIKEYTKDIQKFFEFAAVGSKVNSKGVSFMIDLSTKNHKKVTMDELVEFGTRIKPKIAKYISTQTTKLTSSSLYESSTERKGFAKVFRQNSEVGDSPSRASVDFSLEYKYWIDVLNPSADQMEQIQQAFGIHPLTSEDILTKGTREKIEEYTTYTYLVFNERQQILNSNRFQEVNVNILIFPGLIFTFHNLAINSLSMVMYHVQYQLPAIIPIDWIAYKFLDMITDDFVLMVDSVYREVDYLDTMVSNMTEGNKEEILRRIGIARERLTRIRGSLLSKREILSTLCSTVKTTLFIDQTTKVYLRDVMDHVVLMIERLDMANEMLSNTSNMHLAMISLEIAATDHKMNTSMKCFGAVATIMLPLTVITGLWGMNVQVPGQYGIAPEGQLWFLMVVLSFVLWIIVAGIIFRYKRWL